jgi:solute carrier family 35, member E1
MSPLATVYLFCICFVLFCCLPVVNKRVLNALPAPLTVSVLQFGCGSLVTTLFWKLNIRSPPILVHNNENSGGSSLLLFLSPLRALGLCSTVGQLTAMVSLGAGPVSFTHIVKAMEPFFSAMVSALLLRQWMHPAVYATLIPVVGGVGYACLKERSFSWLAFSMAMMSNLCYAFRAVLSKVAMGGDGGNNSSIGSNLTPPNVLGLITLQSFWISIPIALIGEGYGIRQLWSDAIQHHNSVLLVQEMLLSGLVHYFSNEAMFFCLDSVHPVTFSVGNTLKRVCIMVASVLVFHNDITTQAAVGSVIGIAGALLYSLTKQHYEKLELMEAEKKHDETAKKQR